jgi:hypothetical protein
MRKAKLNELGDKLLSKHYRKLKRNRPTIEQVREEAKRYDETFLKNRFEHSCQPNFDLVAYVQCNRHRQGLPYLTISVRELDVLMRYVPGPLGLGMDVKAIAKDMHCNRKTVQRILSQLRDKLPDEMDQIETMRKVMFRQGGNMYQQMRSLEGLTNDVGCEGVYEEMVERF